MIYPQRDSRRRRKKVWIATGIISGILLLCTILNIWKPNFFTPAILAVGEPVFNARTGILGSINNAWQFVHSKNTLVHENELLKDKVALYDALMQERDYYKDLNAELAHLRTITADSAVIARILSKPGFSPYDTIIINMGEDNGITVGDKVMAGGASILGEISETFSKTSTVTLYSTPERETVVLIGPKAIQAVAKGKGGGNFEIKLPKNTEVQVGDSVSIASTSANVLGKVQYIHDSPADSFEWALFKNSADVMNLRFVTVQKP
jgi:cell shape-determining protein MreC